MFNVWLLCVGVVCVFDYRREMSMLLECVAGAVAGLAIGLFFKGVEFILKRTCGYVISEGYKQLYFFWGGMFMVVYGLPALYAYIGIVKCCAQEVIGFCKRSCLRK